MPRPSDGQQACIPTLLNLRGASGCCTTLEPRCSSLQIKEITLSCKNFSLAPAVSVLLGQKIFTGQNGNKSSCGTSGTLTAAG
ncbi:1-aminocyclopropane-1-carboxylate oxidase, partial [Fusarium oxysporum f. sp. albedinis]